MIKTGRIAIVYKTRDSETLKIIETIKRVLKPEAVEEHQVPNLIKNGLRGFDLVLCIGGDGTLIRTSRSVKDEGLILPVNMGKKGYLIEVNPENLEAYLKKYCSNEFLVEKCFKLRVDYNNKVFNAVNEAAIRNVAGLKQVELLVELNEGSFIVEGDGFLVSTPIGSSAYSLNAGGPFVLSDVNVLVCTPLCARKPLRPLIVDKNETIRVKHLSGEEVKVVLDGEEAFKVDPGETTSITGSSETVNIIRFSNSFNIRRMSRLAGETENG
ncbi:MAG: NAD(+)/NADH kinase [Thermoproteota archaeon]